MELQVGGDGAIRCLVEECLDPFGTCHRPVLVHGQEGAEIAFHLIDDRDVHLLPFGLHPFFVENGSVHDDHSPHLWLFEADLFDGFRELPHGFVQRGDRAAALGGFRDIVGAVLAGEFLIGQFDVGLFEVVEHYDNHFF